MNVGLLYVPRARYIIIEVVCVLFDPEIQSLSKYYVLQQSHFREAVNKSVFLLILFKFWRPPHIMNLDAQILFAKENLVWLRPPTPLWPK